MKYPAFFALAALVVGASASAQSAERVVTIGPNVQWDILETKDGIEGFLDRANLRIEGGKVRYVGRLRYLQPRDDGVAEIIHTGEIDCARRTYLIKAFDMLGAEGELVGSFVATQSDEPVPINPGSHNEALQTRYCP